MKKFFVTAVALVCFFAITTTATSNQSKLSSAYITDDVKVKVFGQTIETDVIAAQKAGESGYRNYVSAADLARDLGYYTEWDPKTKTVLISSFPGYDGPVNPEGVEKIKETFYSNEANLLEGLSNEQLEKLHDLVVYSNKAGLPDYAPILFLLDDYKMHNQGYESAFGEYWDMWK